MRIDLVTVIAQAVNFLVLVLLLRRFLFRPVAAAIAERQRQAAARIAAAERQEAEATARAEALAQERAALEAERAGLLEQATADADAARSRLLEEARAAATDAEQRWRADLGREQQEFLTATRLELARAAESVARHALRDLADADLQARVVGAFLERLRDLDDDTRAALAASDGPLVVVTASALDDESQRQVAEALQGILEATPPLRFETSPDLVCGIRLRAPSRVLGWSIDDYLESLHGRIAQLLDEAAVPRADADAHAS